jgi:multiple sugar transport system substrate-binding protein
MTYQVDESDWYAWEHEWGNQVLNASNQAAFGNAKGAAPLAFFAGLANKKELVISTTANYQDQTDFDSGKAAFDLSSSAGLSYEISGASPGVQVKVAQMPAGPATQATELYGAPFTVFSKATAAQKQAAWLFLKFITEPAQTAYWAMNTGYMPVRRSALNTPALKAYYAKYPDRLAAVNQLDAAVLEPALNGWEKAINDIDTQMSAALTGSKDPTAAMQQAASQVNGDLTNAQ